MIESPRTGIYIRPNKKTAPNKQANNNSNKQNNNKLEIQKKTFENIPSNSQTAEEKANALEKVYAENLDIKK